MLLFKIGGELTEACGPGMPGPYWVVKGKQSATGWERRGQDPSLRMEDSMAADAQRAGRACPAPTGSLKIYGRQWYRNPSGAAAPPPFDKGGRGAERSRTLPTM